MKSKPLPSKHIPHVDTPIELRPLLPQYARPDISRRSALLFPNRLVDQSAAVAEPKTFPSPRANLLQPLPLVDTPHLSSLPSTQSPPLFSLFSLLTNRQNVYPRLLRHCQAGQRRMRTFPPRLFCSPCFITPRLELHDSL